MRIVATLLLTGVMAAAMLYGCHKTTPRPRAPHPRIITFSPAITELVFELGFGDHVVGVTSRCGLPQGQQRPAVGDRLTVSAEAMLAVEPDIIMVQQDVKDFAAVQRLRPEVKLEHFTIERLSEIPAAMERIGRLCNNTSLGDKAAAGFREQLQELTHRVEGLPRPKVLFVMGYENPGTGGGSSFLHDMIVTAGGNDVGERYKRWASLDMESILSLAPDVLVCWVDPGQEAAATLRWQSYKTLPAVISGRVFIISDVGWTIPTGRTPKYTARLAEMIHGKGALAAKATSGPQAEVKP